MKYVEVPLNVAQKAAKVYRPLLPYVRKFIAENRTPSKVEVIDSVSLIETDNSIEDMLAADFKKIKSDFENKTKNELIDIAKEAGIERPERFTKDKLLNKLLGQE